MSILFSDNFNRADGGAGANWTDLLGALNVSSNEVIGSGGNWVARCNGATPASDCWAELDITTLPGATDALEIYVRLNLATSNGYNVSIDSSSTRVRRVDAGVPATIGTLASRPTAGQTVRFEARGSDFSVYYDDVLQATYSEATYTGSQPVLLAGNDTGTRGDNYAHGDLPTISSATPSGTLGTSTTATIGCTTDESAGTLYVVVDTASLAGITASQIKAGQNASSVAADAAGDSAVSGASPSVGVTGLTGGTAYNYAVLQFSGGNSNILTGTFTTDSGGPPPTPPLIAAGGRFINIGSNRILRL